MELIRINKKEELESLLPFMTPIWKEVYKDVIPDKQIDFLLDKYFSVSHLEEFQKNGYLYFFVMDGVQKAGLTAFKIYPSYIYLDKLYFRKEHRHQHLGSSLFSYLLNTYHKDIVLNVNKNNKNAVAAYLHAGFQIDKEETISLPDGMINHDYVLRKKAV
jgi:diamine N-acetyltransferase